MLEIEAAIEGESSDSTYSKKEELLERRAAKDIAKGNLILKEDTADKDTTFDESEPELKDKSEEKTENKSEQADSKSKTTEEAESQSQKEPVKSEK